MISFIVPSFLLLFSLATYAIGSRVSIQPTQPLIEGGDVIIDPGESTQQTVHGPWFKAYYSVSNTYAEVVTFKSVTFEVASREGVSAIFEFDLKQPTELHPGTGLQVQDIYLSDLPPSHSTHYQVYVTFHGWHGPSDLPGDPLKEKGSFETC
jgi:hypothetical protein